MSTQTRRIRGAILDVQEEAWELIDHDAPGTRGEIGGLETAKRLLGLPSYGDDLAAVRLAACNMAARAVIVMAACELDQETTP